MSLNQPAFGKKVALLPNRREALQSAIPAIPLVDLDTLFTPPFGIK